MSGTITFRNYPATNRTPGTFVEIDASRASTGQVQERALVIAPKLATGLAPSGTPYLYTSRDDANRAFGAGSVAAIMASRYRAIDEFGELWVLPVDDDAAAVAATQTTTFVGTATAAGTVAWYIGGTVVSVGVAQGDTASVIASNAVAAANARQDLPVTATAFGAVVTTTAKNKGLLGNGIDVRLNYQGAPFEALPAGVTATVVLNNNGSTNPVTNLTAALANVAGIVAYDFMALAFSDPASLNAIGQFLSDASGTWSWGQQLFGGAFVGYSATLSGLTTFGTARNDQHVSVIGAYDSPSAPFAWAADYAATSAISLRANPAVPLQGLPLRVLAPPLASQFTRSERNVLLHDGISTFAVDRQGTVTIERAITTYQNNAAGFPDDSYLDVETLFTLQFVGRDLSTYLGSQFQRKILVSNGTRIPVGSAMITPETVRLSMNARYRTLADAGLVQEPDDFAKKSVAENAGHGLLRLLAPLVLANQLRQIAILLSFTKP